MGLAGMKGHRWWLLIIAFGMSISRSFRIKSIPFYKDLCLIYSDGMSEQKAPENITEGDDNRLCESTKGSGISRCRTTWHPPMDRYFIGLMLDQARSGNQIEGAFRKQAWTEMVKLFNAKFDSSFTVDVLKNRYKTMRRQYNAIKSLLRSDGFCWDDERHMVTADDNVWQDYIKAHRDARQFMTRPIPYYKDLCVVCGDSEESDCFVATDWFDPEAEFHEGTTDLSSSGEEQDINSLFCEPKNKRDHQNGTSPVKLKKPRVDETKAMGIEDAVEAIQALPDMDEELILDACDLLEDDLKAKTFLALNVKLRKKWLLRKLRLHESDCFVATDWFDPEAEFHEGTTDLSSSGEEQDINSLFCEPKNKRDHQNGTSPVKLKKPRVDETKAMGIEDAVEAIQALPDMDEELILDACDLLEDDLKAKTFLALNVKLRKKWLLRKLRLHVT
ncbi:hypothetical protein F2Q68_00009668 [Brassica cretica]|uniref:Myb/SANT-like domain-containing protein n=1 Tax=Brassica cretica TaxID=69181 RepID=A0A8S9KZ50_BRACR|nr:hypothetical protein F2Q68_00009668 [Brassica cretica]